MKDVIGCLPPTSVLPGPIDWFLEIGVPQEFPCEPLLRELHEHHLQTGRSGQLHHRKAVRVACDQDDSINYSISRIGSNIKAKPHGTYVVYMPFLIALLPNPQIEEP